MNGNSKESASKQRLSRTIKVAPTTRAIRAALAVSATVLALSGSGAALAGTCIVSGTNEVTCSGVFTDDVTNTVPVVDVIPDLTLIVADGSTVDPAVGTNGITSTWGGDATVISYADITTTDAYGIYMSTTDGAGTIENYGNINTTADTTDASGIYMYSYGDGTVTNSGTVFAAASTGTSYNATGIDAYSYNNLTVTNTADGTVIGGSYSGTGIGIDAEAYYNVDVTNDGMVGGSSFPGTAIGIFGYSSDGDVTITNNGTVEAY